MCYTGYLSLTDYDVINAPRFVGLDNYREHARRTRRSRLALRNTFFFALLYVPLPSSSSRWRWRCC